MSDTVINTITRAELGVELWSLVTDDWYDEVKTHRKYGSFWIKLIFEIDEESLPDRPDLWGFWMTGDGLTWSDTDGLDDEPTVLYRAELQTKLVEVEEWVRV
jgi:hypothetical protein